MENSDLIRALMDKTEPDCHVLRSLVRNPVNLNDVSILGKALYISISRGFLSSLQILLEAGVSPNTKLERNEETPLHCSSRYKQGTEMVQALLKHGADVNAEDRFKRTPLHNATFYQCVENMHELLKNGARVDATDYDGHTPLFTAIYLVRNVSTVKILLSASANVNCRNKEGLTPLHCAVEMHSPRVVRLILQHKADANIKNIEGDTPLHCAATRTQKTIELIRELLEGGARLNELNNGGRSPLYYAIEAYNEEAIRELLRCGASFDIVECLAMLYNTSLERWRLQEITPIVHELIRYVFISSSLSLENIRQQLMEGRAVYILRLISTRECNLENFTHACWFEVEALSKMNCDCGESSIWGSINNCEKCMCDTHQAILKILFSGRKSNFGDAFFYRLSKEFLLEVTVNLMSYFEFKESKMRHILPWPCRKEIERYVSFEDLVLFLQSKQSEMDSFEFEKFVRFLKGDSFVKSFSDISLPAPQTTSCFSNNLKK